MKSLFILLILIIPITSLGQITIKGYIQNEIGEVLPGCAIREAGSTNSTMSNQIGQFTIQVQNNSSILEISNLGFKPLTIKVDSIDHENFVAIMSEYDLEDLNIIAPSPPYVEIGYNGLITSQPIGIHIEYSGWGDKFRSNFNFSTNDLISNLYSFEIGPYRFGKSKLYNYLNLYAKGLILRSNSDLFICNRFYIMRKFILNMGIGDDRRENFKDKLIFLTGIKTAIGLPLPFLTNYLSFDLFYNSDHFDWTSFIYTELYNKNYKNLSFGLGYQKVYNQKNIILNLNYKYYLYKR